MAMCSALTKAGKPCKNEEHSVKSGLCWAHLPPLSAQELAAQEDALAAIQRDQMLRAKNAGEEIEPWEEGSEGDIRATSCFLINPENLRIANTAEDKRRMVSAHRASKVFVLAYADSYAVQTYLITAKDAWDSMRTPTQRANGSGTWKRIVDSSS